MFKVLEKSEKEFRNKYFITADMYGFINDKLGSREVEINLEDSPMFLSFIVCCDDLSDSDFVDLQKGYYDLVCDSIPIMDRKHLEFDVKDSSEDEINDFFNYLSEYSSYVFRIV
jgi:hypothetical protein